MKKYRNCPAPTVVMQLSTVKFQAFLVSAAAYRCTVHTGTRVCACVCVCLFVCVCVSWNPICDPTSRQPQSRFDAHTFVHTRNRLAYDYRRYWGNNRVMRISKIWMEKFPEDNRCFSPPPPPPGTGDRHTSTCRHAHAMSGRTDAVAWPWPGLPGWPFRGQIWQIWPFFDRLASNFF